MIPVNTPLLNGNEKKFLIKCIRQGYISSEGPFVKEFESKFSEYLGAKYGTAVCNGTAAIETALYGIGIGKNDEVIMPSFTIISCAISAIRLGARPVLVDMEPGTWNMDVSRIEEKITSRTKAIMTVHIYGHPVDMDPIFRLAKKYNLKIVEDAAEAHGAEYFSKVRGNKWFKCGSMGDVSAFSFYANKIVTTGEGGIVIANSLEIAKRAASYRNLCFDPQKRFYHTELGYNFRMTNLQAAVGVAQLQRIKEFISIKARLGDCYKRGLSSVPGVRLQVIKPYARPVCWMYAIELDRFAGIDAATMISKLIKNGIESRPFFMGLHAQPVFKKMRFFKGEKYPNTDNAYKQGLYLPSGMNLTIREVNKVCSTINSIIKTSG